MAKQIVTFQTRWFCTRCNATTPHTSKFVPKQGKIYRCSRCGNEFSVEYGRNKGRPSQPLHVRITKLIPPIRYIVHCKRCDYVWITRYAQKPVACWKCQSHNIEVVETTNRLRGQHISLYLKPLQIAKLDRLIQKGIFQSRQEAIRHAIDKLLQNLKEKET